MLHTNRNSLGAFIISFVVLGNTTAFSAPDIELKGTWVLKGAATGAAADESNKDATCKVRMSEGSAKSSVTIKDLDSAAEFEHTWTKPPEQQRLGEIRVFDIGVKTVSKRGGWPLGASTIVWAEWKDKNGKPVKMRQSVAASVNNTDVANGKADVGFPSPSELWPGTNRIDLHVRTECSAWTMLEGVGADAVYPYIFIPDAEAVKEEPKPPKPKTNAEIDLQILPTDIMLYSVTDVKWREECSDRQIVGVVVRNLSKKIAENVNVQLSYTKFGETEHHIITNAKMGNLPAPGANGKPYEGYIKMVWPLGEDNLDDFTLSARAYIPGEEDINPDDNYAGITGSIYFAHNGTRAFNWYEDCYGFDNYGWEGRDAEEAVESLVASVVRNMKGNSNYQGVMKRLLFPQTYTRLQKYISATMLMGDGGHCLGMASAVGAYFMDPKLKPVAGIVADMDMRSASQDIGIYHRMQLAPLTDALLSGKFYSGDALSLGKLWASVRKSLSDKREPILVNYYGTGGHSLLAYKLIEIHGENPSIYLYDPNISAMTHGDRAMTQMVLANVNDKGQGVAWPDLMMQYYASWVRMFTTTPLYKDVPSSVISSLVPVMEEEVSKFIENLDEKKQTQLVVRCPADALITDEKGRRTGVAAGKSVNEIPDAEVKSKGEVEVYMLPVSGSYKLSITATTAGAMGVDLIRADGPKKAGLTSFEKIKLGTKTVVNGTITNGRLTLQQSGDQQITPTTDAVLYDGKLTGKVGVSVGETAKQPEQPSTESTSGLNKYIHRSGDYQLSYPADWELMRDDKRKEDALYIKELNLMMMMPDSVIDVSAQTASKTIDALQKKWAQVLPDAVVSKTEFGGIPSVLIAAYDKKSKGMLWQIYSVNNGKQYELSLVQTNLPAMKADPPREGMAILQSLKALK